jgi:preprotein translocase subunit SecD
MKTLRYFLIVMMMIIAVHFGRSQNSVWKLQTFTLQSLTKNASGELLDKSREILLKRLACMNLQDVHVTVNYPLSELLITVRDTIDNRLLPDVLLEQGHVNFIETVNRQEVLTTPDSSFNEQNIKEAHADFSSPAYPALSITFKEDVWTSWKEATARNMNKSMAFVIDGKVYCAPMIQGEIPNGKISMTGTGFSQAEIRKLVAVISNGPLPLKYTLVSGK